LLFDVFKNIKILVPHFSFPIVYVVKGGCLKPIDPHIRNLFQKYLAGTVTTQELDKLLTYFGLTEHTEQLKSLILDQFGKEVSSDVSPERVDRIAGRMDKAVLKHMRTDIRIFSLYKWLAAVSAAVVVIVGTVTYIHWNRNQVSQAMGQVQEILPGTNRATFTIEGSEPIQLSEAQTTLRNTGDTISYGNGESIMVSNAIQWATIATPRAGQYQIVLEDGTKVWLNAASRIRYPTRFVGHERRVYISGEVYLEVAHLKDHKPFIVETDRQTIRVLGTKFNVEAYSDANIQSTTLVEGAVQIENTKANDVRILQPGQQARTAQLGTTSIVQVDPQDYIAWIDGFITLNSLDLNQVVRQLERWYDVDFEAIPEALGKKKVFGSLKRDLPLKDVLQALEGNYDVKFTMNERRVDVKGK